MPVFTPNNYTLQMSRALSSYCRFAHLIKSRTSPFKVTGKISFFLSALSVTLRFKSNFLTTEAQRTQSQEKLLPKNFTTLKGLVLKSINLENSSLSGLTQKFLKSLIYRTAFSTRGFANAQRLVREERREFVECA